MTPPAWLLVGLVFILAGSVLMFALASLRRDFRNAEPAEFVETPRSFEPKTTYSAQHMVGRPGPAPVEYKSVETSAQVWISTPDRPSTRGRMAKAEANVRVIKVIDELERMKRQLTCKAGHLRTDENIRMEGNHARCIPCRREYDAKRRAKA